MAGVSQSGGLSQRENGPRGRGYSEADPARSIFLSREDQSNARSDHHCREAKLNCLYSKFAILNEKSPGISAGNDLTRFEHQYFFTNFDRFSGIVSYVQHWNTEFVMHGAKLLKDHAL